MSRIGPSVPFDGSPIQQGVYVGAIISMDGTVDADGLGFPEDVYYTVSWGDGSNNIVWPGALPSHRRPVVSPGKILPARPGDRCFVQIVGNSFYFLIFESLLPGVCE